MDTNSTSTATDAFGKELWDYYHGEDVAEIIERDDGYIDAGVNNPKAYFSDYEEWPIIEKEAIGFAHGYVLDVGCGAGRHSLYLQEKGLEVLGVDNSPLAVEVSRLRGVKQTKVLPFEQIATLKPSQFDTILMLGHNFGLFGSFEKAQRLLKTLDGLTTPQAIIIATTRDPYITDSSEHDDYQEWNRKRDRMTGQIKIRVRRGKFVGPWFDYLFVSQDELRTLLEGTGWKIRKIIQDTDESPSYAMILEKS